MYSTCTDVFQMCIQIHTQMYLNDFEIHVYILWENTQMYLNVFKIMYTYIIPTQMYLSVFEIHVRIHTTYIEKLPSRHIHIEKIDANVFYRDMYIFTITRKLKRQNVFYRDIYVFILYSTYTSALHRFLLLSWNSILLCIPKNNNLINYCILILFTFSSFLLQISPIRFYFVLAKSFSSLMILHFWTQIIPVVFVSQ